MQSAPWAAGGGLFLWAFSAVAGDAGEQACGAGALCKGRGTNSRQAGGQLRSEQSETLWAPERRVVEPGTGQVAGRQQLVRVRRVRP